ncbi:MAG: RNA-binding S4 domain-containing protein [Pirellulales bacterium]|nr:RNA-binding S4 domain-containing protein [Pirellulales bacterium]
MTEAEQPTIRLDQFLKAQGIADTGGQAKLLIQEGLVQVNGETETRRRRQLRAGDTVQVADQKMKVEFGSTEY